MDSVFPFHRYVVLPPALALDAQESVKPGYAPNGCHSAPRSLRSSVRWGRERRGLGAAGRCLKSPERAAGMHGAPRYDSVPDKGHQVFS